MDIILYNIGTAIILFLMGYLIGSIPNAIWIGKVFFHKDPRDFGSGNAGGTSAGRVFGKKIGVLVILLDGFKLIIPMYIAWVILVKAPIYHGVPLMGSLEEQLLGLNNYVINWPIYWIMALGVSIGHCFPVFAGFRGGKNVSTFYGLVLGASWVMGLIPIIFFFIILKWKKYVSLASILSSWFAVLLTWIWAILIQTHAVPVEWAYIVSYGHSLLCNYVFAIMATVSATLLTFSHRTNISRLKNGTESKIKWMK